MLLLTEDLVKLLLALLIGGLIGAEREFRDKAAGFRTIILICVGAALFTMFSLKLGGDADPVRIAASVVSGVGFLGAGVILRGGGRIIGLTTASTIWLAAALGMGVGGGHFLFSGVAAGTILIVLWIFPMVEAWIDNTQERRTYEVVCAINPEKFAQLGAALRESGLRVREPKLLKQGADMVCSWQTSGSPKNHERATARLFADGEVKEFRY